MRSSWKGLILTNNDNLFPASYKAEPWQQQLQQYLFFYNGRRWMVRRVRPYFMNKKFSFFIKNGPKGRPIRAKFYNLRRNKKRKPRK